MEPGLKAEAFLPTLIGKKAIVVHTHMMLARRFGGIVDTSAMPPLQLKVFGDV
jgi:hypothetical protein